MAPVKRVMRLAAATLIAVSASVQTPSDFSGRWLLAPEPVGTASAARSTPAMGTGWGSDISIAQDAKTLTIEFAQFARGDMQPPIKLVYFLDGSESRNTINVGRGPQEQISKTAWDGTKLTISTVRTFRSAPGDKPMTLQTTQVLFLDSPDTLVVETTHGGALGGQPSTSRAVYKKN
jgi:hypothetical protein